MDPFRELGRALLLLGGLLVLLGALLYFGSRLPFRLGRLPGDIVHRGEHTTFYFPIVTCLILSVGSDLNLLALLPFSSLRSSTSSPKDFAGQIARLFEIIVTFSAPENP